MATYVNDLRLKEIATGDESGTWGASTNTNLELIAEAFSFGTEAITTNADTHTTTIADGSTDPGRSIFLKYTGTLDSTCTITIGPNTVSKLWLIENATSGGFSIIIKQGSGATVTIANGQTKAIYSDGAGSGGAMVDAFQDLSIPDLFIDDDLTFTSDSAVITFGADGDTTLTHTDGSGLTLNSTNKLMFNDASQFIQGSSATVLSLGATDEIDLTATAIDVNGTIDVSGNATLGGTLGVTGAVTADAGISIDNITIDGTEIDLSSGDLTIDVAGDIIFDADGDDFFFAAAGTNIGKITNSSSDFLIRSLVQDKDIIFKGDDAGSVITALTLDMSDAGAAAFNAGATFGGNVGIGGSPAFSTLEVIGDKTESNNLQLTLKGSTNTNKQMIMGFDTTADTAHVTTQIAGSAPTPLIFKTGNVVFNESSTDSDFRIESNNNANLFTVDAGNDHINIGQNVDYGGVVNIASGDNSAQLVLISTDTDSDFGPALSLYRASASSAADNDGLGQISLQGLNDANQATTYAQQFAMIEDASDGTEDGMFILKTIVNGSTRSRMAMTSASGTVFNEDGQDLDFRVESDTQANAFSVLGSTGSVGFGVADGDVTSDGTAARTYVGIIGSGNRGRLNLGTTASNGADAGTLAFTNGTNSLAELVVDTHSGVQNAGDFTLDVTGDIVFDADGGDFNFKDGGTSLLSISNAGSNNVQISSQISDGDLIIKGVDGGSVITALTFDMSNAGTATFGSSIITPTNGVIESSSSAGSLTISGGATNKGGQILLRGGNGDSDIIFKSQASTATPREVARVGPSEMVVNEGSVDYDFRVESDNSTHAFIIDGASGAAGFGTSLNSDLHGSATNILLGRAGSLYAERSSALGIPVTAIGYNFYIDSDTGNYAARITDGGSNLAMGDGTFSFNTAASVSAGAAITYISRMNIGTSSVVVNESGASSDFRVESDSHSNMLTVNASGDCVGINNDGTSARLTVTQTSASNITTYLFNNASTIANSSASILYIQTTGDSAIQDGYKIVTFADADTVIGTISSASSSTNVAYNTSSDERLKENIVDMESQLDKVLAAKPRQFTWKKNGATSQGFVAQELHKVFPEAVTVGGEDPTESPWSVDYGRVTPFLMKAIQEQQEQIEELKAEIAKLKGG